MTMHGIYKTTGYWQTQAAKKDWDYIAEFAKKNGFGEFAKEIAPAENNSWRIIDKRIAKLRSVMEDHELDVPPCPSNTDAFNEWLNHQPQQEIPTDQQMRKAEMPTLPGLE